MTEAERIAAMVGRTLVRVMGCEKDSGCVDFECSGGGRYMMHHHQDCCEYVSVEDVIGDVSDLIGSPLTMFEYVTENDETPIDGSGTWTFYKMATNKGSVTIRWYGGSNGYYSESVDFDTVKEPSP
jgi:hypothetical protein